MFLPRRVLTQEQQDSLEFQKLAKYDRDPEFIDSHMAADLLRHLLLQGVAAIDARLMNRPTAVGYFAKALEELAASVCYSFSEALEAMDRAEDFEFTELDKLLNERYRDPEESEIEQPTRKRAKSAK